MVAVLFRTIRRVLAVSLVLVAAPHAVFAGGATLPPLLPREMLFVKPAPMQAFRLSPDGRVVSYLAPDAAGVQQLWVRNVNRGDVRRLTDLPQPGVASYVWAENNRIMCYERSAAAGPQLIGLELATGRERTLIAIDGARFGNFIGRASAPDELLVTIRLPKAAEDDVYRLHVTTGTLELDTKNPGGVPGKQFFADGSLRVRAAQRMTAGWQRRGAGARCPVGALAVVDDRQLHLQPGGRSLRRHR
jgi:hypothetical protein